jgi:hypothetical protein
MIYGHYYFEQVGDITKDGPNGSQVWRLRKLGPRHPRTLTEIDVADDGGLSSITQGFGQAGKPPPKIPVDRLVAYIWDQEPGNWVGRSIYRPMYRNYLVKDRLLRVDAIKHERNGVGMPIVEAPPGATPADIQELDNMAQEYKVGERGGGAVPYQTKLRLVGTEGSIPDTIGSIRFQNEEMARSMLMMFMQLGQTETGSRALGQSFIDWFAEQQTFIADWVVATTVQYVIEDWWNWNVDPAAVRTPTLGYVRDEQAKPTLQDFAGAQLPPEVNTAPSESGPTPQTSARRGRRGQSPSPHIAGEADPTGVDPTVSPSAMPAPRLPARKLRRQPYPQEIAAGVDFAGLDEDAQAGQVDAEAAWNAERAAMMTRIRDAIAAAKPSNVVEVVAKAGADAATEAAAAMAEAGTGTPAAAAAAEEAFNKVIASTAHVATGRAREELVKQGLLRAVHYGGSTKLIVGEKGRELAQDHMISLRASLTGNSERLAARVKDAYAKMDDLANRVYNDMLARQDVFASDQIKGMINTAVNAARTEVFTDADNDGNRISMYASELLDSNTCGPCLDIDGEGLSQEDAFALYAGGGYIDCEGGGRCRGTVVAVYEGERS